MKENQSLVQESGSGKQKGRKMPEIKTSIPDINNLLKVRQLLTRFERTIRYSLFFPNLFVHNTNYKIAAWNFSH